MHIPAVSATEVDARPATVMVVGGYGAVGSRICHALAAHRHLCVVVAGRRRDRAVALAGALRWGDGRLLDLDEPATWEAATLGVDCVVMCMDQKDTRFVQFLFARGIDYVDITASDHFFRAIECLAPTRSAAMLSVGLAPGLTNLMAAHGAARLQQPERVEIGLLVGLGDSHGKAGLAWIADRLFDPSRPRGTTAIAFGFGQGRRAAYFVDFSDQHAIRRTLPVGSASTRMAFESRLATAALFATAGTLAGRRWARNLLLASVSRLRFGSRMCNVSVHVHGRHNGRPATASVHFAGEVETALTATLATAQIVEFLHGRSEPGVWHSHQLLDVEAAIGTVAAAIGRVDIEPLEIGP